MLQTGDDGAQDLASVARIVLGTLAGKSALSSIAAGAPITAGTIMSAVVQICRKERDIQNDNHEATRVCVCVTDGNRLNEWD